MRAFIGCEPFELLVDCVVYFEFGLEFLEAVRGNNGVVKIHTRIPCVWQIVEPSFHRIFANLVRSLRTDHGIMKLEAVRETSYAWGLQYWWLLRGRVTRRACLRS